MRFRITWLVGLLLSVMMPGYAAGFTLTSPAYANNAVIPTKFTCDGDNISPALSWQHAPSNTSTYALIFSVPDWPSGNIFLWVVYNIPGNLTFLPEGANKHLPAEASTGINYYGEDGYIGPCPPDSIPLHYLFVLYALDASLNIGDDADISDVFSEIKKHFIAKATLVGVYKH